MSQKLLDRFAKENFGRKYIPVLHGRCTSIAPTVLILKQNREWWKKPFHRSEMKVLSKLERLVDKNHIDVYENISESLLNRSTRKLEKKDISEEVVEHDLSVEILYNSGVGCKATRKMGDIILGHMDEEFYDDLALRDVLESAVLDPEKMAVYARHQLYIVTGVIYSAKLRFAGKRLSSTEVNAHLSTKSTLGSWASKLGDVKGDYTSTRLKPGLVERTKRAPFLFTVCRVVYDKEAKRIKLPDNVFVGKDVVSRGTAAVAKPEPILVRVKLGEKEDDKFDYNVVEPPDEENENTGNDILCIKELEQKLERVKDLLLSVRSEKERETLIVKYLLMLESTFSGNYQLYVDDCSQSTKPGDSILAALGLKDDDIMSEGGLELIQDYGSILCHLHHISGHDREKWEELMMILNEEEAKSDGVVEKPTDDA